MNTFRHSGKLGDIIYSLPTVRALGGGAFYVDATTRYPEKPALGADAAKGMVELLKTQDYIAHADIYSGQPISCELDQFRKKATPAHVFNAVNSKIDMIVESFGGKIVKELRRQFVPTLQIDLPQFHWEAAGLPGKVDTSRPWITGITPRPIAEIVISRTDRYSGQFNWRLLQAYADRSVFIGFEEEWQSFSRLYFTVKFCRVASLVEFAQIVAGAKLYVGNQSLGLALADAMLIPRAAELGEANSIRMSPVRSYKNITHQVVEEHIHL